MSKKPQYDPEEIRFPDQKIEISPLVPEMEKSYIEYAMSVIVGRALPDVRDGLKPVHRRILYAMYEDNLTARQALQEVAPPAWATCWAATIPTATQSVYDALVRLAQDFSMRYPAGGRPRQLRLHRRRSPGRLPLHRGPHVQAGRRDAAGH